MDANTIDTESLNDVVAAEFHAWLDQNDAHAENAHAALQTLLSEASDALSPRQFAAYVELMDLMAKATGRD